jgi:hypothetical protein
MILYIAAVAALGFVNCCVLRAGDPELKDDYVARLAAALAVQVEAGIRLESAVTVQPEPEIRLEDWMLNLNDGFLAETEEEKLVVEDWMLYPTYYTIPDYLIVENEEKFELEDWMLEPSDYVIEHLLIAKSDR